jgi:hypothetical protein
MTQFLFLDGVSEPRGADQFSCRKVEGVEDHDAPTCSATAATALDLESHRLDVELAMHGPAASKLDHDEAPSDSVIVRALKRIELGPEAVPDR